MKITGLGQAGLLIADQKMRFLIDPYLSNYVVESGVGSAANFSRIFPPPFQPQELTGISAIFITHNHLDHCDPQTIGPILANHPQCLVIGPQPALDFLRQEGISIKQLCLAPVFKTQTIGSIRYTALPSAHYELDQDQATGQYPNLGFVIECQGNHFYHSGDTILYDRMLENLKSISLHYDFCCLPVNGRDAQREAKGMIGNLHPEEALELTDALHARLLIPLHNDLFAANQLDPQRLNHYTKEKFHHLQVKWLQPGEEFIFNKKEVGQ